jgi:ABC-2 type transport system permease protein
VIRRLARAIRLYPALLRIGFAEAVAYRAEFLIWILTTTMPLVMLALWSAVAREAPVGRFDSTEFVAYFLATLLTRMLTGAWVVWLLVDEIRRGVLAQRLLRPIHPVLTYSAENLAAVPLRVVFALPVALILLFSVAAERLTTDPATIAVFVASLLGAWLINFLTMVAIGALAFFIESALGVFGLWLSFHFVLSGYLVPLELFPDWLRSASEVLPFRFMVSFPVETLTGRLAAGEALALLGWQFAWVAASGTAAALAWRAGMRRFAAFGG